MNEQRKRECNSPVNSLRHKGTVSRLVPGRAGSWLRSALLLTAFLALVPLVSWSFISARSGALVPEPVKIEGMIKRRDIREIESSPDELKNLRHAFFMLKKNPPTCSDTTAKSDYDCWAAYHNNFTLYGCRHRIDLFWPWHRYHLVEFEKALRNSDPAHPERVKDVMLPYWAWSQAPSGKYFPASVEQEDLNPGEYYSEDCPDPTQKCKNPLWVDGRRENLDCQTVEAACVDEALALPTWRDFGGGQVTGQISDFELQAHNFMHSDYIGGPMANPNTAARDPLYWFFHAFIDKVWDQWQLMHESDPCSLTNVPKPDRALKIGDWPPKDVKFQNVICTKNLGYEYVSFGPPVIATLPSCPPPNSSCDPQTPFTPISLRAASAIGEFQKAELSFSGVSVPEDFSYNARILLHPASVKYLPGDKAFLDKYIATYFVAWKQGGHHMSVKSPGHSATMDLQLDVTRKVKELMSEGRDNGLVATIIFAPSSKAEKSSAIVFRRDVNFKKASLILEGEGSSKKIPLTLSGRGKAKKERRL
jgi:tyrosinase